jgi:flagellar hook-associated protein 2
MNFGSTSGISFGGIASGLDTEGIITQLSALERSSISRLKLQKSKLTQQADLYGAFKSQISGIAQAANALNASDAFKAVGIQVSDTNAISVTTTTGVQPGIYDFKVSKLAQAQKVSTNAQASTTTALGQTGQFVVNGKVVNVEATDTLQSIANKVNGLGSGISAGVINGGPGQAYLTFTSAKTGVANKMEISDLTGTTLASLGVLSGASTIRQPITNGATSFALSSDSTSIASQIGATGLGPATVQVNGTNVTIDLSVDSLQAVADKINLAATGAAASVVASVDKGITKFSLSISGATTPTFVDSGNTLTSLGILQQGFGRELIQAQDAAYTIDGVPLTSASNTIDSVVTGASITLLKADPLVPTESKLTLSNDSSAVSEKVKGIMTAFNATQAFIDQNSRFDADTFESGPLFSDSIVRQFQSAAQATLFTNVPGLTGTYRNLIDLGFTLDSKGKMQVDDAKLQAAIAADPIGVQKVFQNFGTSTTGALSYVSSTSASLTSGITPYDVNITQLATKTQYIAGTAKTGANTTSEKLTFAGNAFGSGTVDITIDVGATMTDIVNKINADPRLKEAVVASSVGGKLQIDGVKYGKNGQFTLVSNQSPLATNSGVGFAAGSLVNGVDVAGTIAGQAATGVGQFLSGDSTNTVAGGLQIQYTGTTLGAVGSMSFTKGLVGVLNNTLNSFTDPVNGQTITGQNSLTAQAASIQGQIDAVNKRADEKAVELRSRFAAMEQRIQQLQAQGNQIASLLPRTS